MDTKPDPTTRRPVDEVLRAYPPLPRVRRLKPRAVALILGALALLFCGRMTVKLFDHQVESDDQFSGTRLRATDDMLQRGPIGQLPTDYSFIPPEPPPPEPVVELPAHETVEEPPELSAEQRRRLEALRQEMENALDSPICFAGTRIAQPVSQQPTIGMPFQRDEAFPDMGDVASDQRPRSDAHNRAFLREVANVKTRVDSALELPCSPYELKAGAIIPAALVTAINSDLPGDVIGQVTANVYDSVTGRHLLVPQGTRMIGRYNSEVLNGQNRVLIAWQRLIFPNGSSIILEAMPGTDAAGVSGMADRVDYHGAQLAGATLLSTLVALGGNFAADVNREQQELAIVANTVAEQASRVAQRIIDRELDIKPTILIRAGLPLNVLVNRDLELAPYAPRGCQ
ncbi:MAG: TrbI/VirB10 family protein [Phycisphaerae bacterium]|jgi:type IV secretion system protein VirB10